MIDNLSQRLFNSVKKTFCRKTWILTGNLSYLMFLKKKKFRETLQKDQSKPCYSSLYSIYVCVYVCIYMSRQTHMVKLSKKSDQAAHCQWLMLRCFYMLWQQPPLRAGRVYAWIHSYIRCIHEALSSYKASKNLYLKWINSLLCKLTLFGVSPAGLCDCRLTLQIFTCNSFTVLSLSRALFIGKIATGDLIWQCLGAPTSDSIQCFRLISVDSCLTVVLNTDQMSSCMSKWTRGFPEGLNAT